MVEIKNKKLIWNIESFFVFWSLIGDLETEKNKKVQLNLYIFFSQAILKEGEVDFPSVM